MTTTTRRLRELLARDETLLMPFTYDGFTARIAEEAGFDAVYMSGFGTAMSKGMPDVGLLTQTEMVQNAAYVVEAVEVPVIADADTGYGNAINVRRTIRAYERAGVAGVHIEDQVAPKKCGFFDGKQVIDAGEAAAKVRAAVEARRDDDFVVIARCDALTVNGWDDTERRCRAYAEAGADLVFVDGIRTADDLSEFARRLGDLPLMYNGELPSRRRGQDGVQGPDPSGRRLLAVSDHQGDDGRTAAAGDDHGARTVGQRRRAAHEHRQRARPRPHHGPRTPLLDHVTARAHACAPPLSRIRSMRRRTFQASGALLSQLR